MNTELNMESDLVAPQIRYLREQEVTQMYTSALRQLEQAVVAAYINCLVLINPSSPLLSSKKKTGNGENGTNVGIGTGRTGRLFIDTSALPLPEKAHSETETNIIGRQAARIREEYMEAYEKYDAAKRALFRLENHILDSFSPENGPQPQSKPQPNSPILAPLSSGSRS